MTEVDKKSASGGSMAKGVLVLIIFLVCAGGGGFAVGFTQKFAPVQNVAPSAADTTTSTATNSSSTSSTGLKKVYWLSTHGWERAGYAIKVYINDHSVGTFQTPDRIEEVTKYLKPGSNKIRFDAKALPAGNRNDYSGANLQIALMQGEKFSARGYKNGSKLVQYERKVTETQDFDDTQDVEIIE